MYAFDPIYPHWLSETILSLQPPKQLLWFYQHLTRTFERKTVISRESRLKAINPAPIFALTGHSDAWTCSLRQAAKGTALNS